MIDYKAYGSIDPLLARLNKANVKLIPKTGSILDDICRGASIGISIDPVTGAPILAHEEYIQIYNSQTVEQAELDVHGSVLTDYLPLVVKGARRDVEIANAVVVPAIRDITERVNSYLASMKPHQLLGFEIKQVFPPKPLETGVLDTYFEEYRHASMTPVALHISLPELSVAEITERTMTGSPLVDKDIKTWLATKGDDWLMMAYEDIFELPKQPSSGMTRSWVSLQQDPVHGQDYMLFAFLFSRRLIDAPIEGTSATLRVWNNTFSEMRDMAAKYLLTVTEALARQARTGVLVLGVQDRVVTVYGPVYKDWIATGSPEILYGLSTCSQYAYTVEGIAAETPRYLKAWSMHEATLRLTEANRMHGEFLNGMRTAFNGWLLAMPHEERATYGQIDQLLAEWNQRVLELRQSDAEQIVLTVLRMLCEVVFKRTNAYKFLMLHHEVSTQNPKLNEQEAAALALQQFIIDFLFEQVEIIR